MAFFKFRTASKPEAEAAVAPAPESIEAMRRRALHRLVGAAVLVLLGVVGFPLLFDTQPRPVKVDIPIEIPDKNGVKPLELGSAAPVEPSLSASGPASAVVPTTAPPTTPPATVAPAPVAAPRPAPAPAPAAAPTAAPTPTAAPAAKPPAPDAAEAARARALLDGKEPPSGAAERFVVQVGAYTDAAKLREVRQKLEKTGLKTYTQVVDSKEGKRTRVRIGPYASQAEADKAANRVKALDLPASVLKM